jgi:hypothetical protein
MDQPLGPIHDAFHNGFHPAHFPQYIHVDAAFTTGNIIRDFRLRHPTANAVLDQLKMALTPCFAVIMLRQNIALLVVTIGIHAGKRTNRSGSGKRARALAIGHGNAFATLDQGMHFPAGNKNGLDFGRVKRLHVCQQAGHHRLFKFSEPQT